MPVDIINMTLSGQYIYNILQRYVNYTDTQFIVVELMCDSNKNTGFMMRSDGYADLSAFCRELSDMANDKNPYEINVYVATEVSRDLVLKFKRHGSTKKYILKPYRRDVESLFSPPVFRAPDTERSMLIKKITDDIKDIAMRSEYVIRTIHSTWCYNFDSTVRDSYYFGSMNSPVDISDIIDRIENDLHEYVVCIFIGYTDEHGQYATHTYFFTPIH